MRVTDQLNAAQTFMMSPRDLELAILAGRCDLLLQIPRPVARTDRDHVLELRHA